jgi:hypothetical protein
VILEVIYPYPVQQVWRALTDSRALAKWLMPNDFRPRLGRKFCFVGETQAAGRKVTCLRLEHRQADAAVAADWTAPVDALEALLGEMQRAIASGGPEDALLTVGRDQIQQAIERLALGWRAHRVRAVAIHRQAWRR